MKILITGGAGFIGSHIAEKCLERGHSVRVLDDLSSGNIKNLDGLDLEFIRGSIMNRLDLQRAMKDMEGVVHLAALVSAPESLDRAAEYVEINTLGTAMVLEEAGVAGVSSLVMASSSAVYGNAPELPKRETMLPSPETPYASSKLEGEHLCRVMGMKYGIRTMCYRFFNIYGPRQDPSSPYSSVISRFSEAAAQSKDITIYGDGRQTRDFVFVRDLASILVLSMEKGCTGLANLATGRSVTVLELAEAIRNITGTPINIIFSDQRAGDVKFSSAGIERLGEMGFATTTDLMTGLRETLASFKSER